MRDTQFPAAEPLWWPWLRAQAGRWGRQVGLDHWPAFRSHTCMEVAALQPLSGAWGGAASGRQQLLVVGSAAKGLEQGACAALAAGPAALLMYKSGSRRHTPKGEKFHLQMLSLK